MARSRNIKPGIVLNDSLAGLAHWVRLLFIYLWTIADREGRLEDNPRRIGAALFPYEADLPFDEGLQQLHEARFIKRYAVEMPEPVTEKPEQAVKRNCFIQLTNWAKHQNPHPKELASVIPPPPTSNELVTEKPRLVTEKPEQARPLPSSLLPDSPLPNTGIAASGFNEFWTAYPNKIGMDSACRAWVAIVTEDLVPEITAGLNRWLKSDQWQRDDGRFIPAPAKWLQDRKWLDVPRLAIVERSGPKPSPDGIDPSAEWIPPWRVKAAS